MLWDTIGSGIDSGVVGVGAVNKACPLHAESMKRILKRNEGMRQVAFIGVFLRIP